MNDNLTILLDLYCTPAVGYVGPRCYAGEAGYRILDSKKESVADIALDVANFATLHPRAHLDTWARRIDNTRVFCPLIDSTAVKGTPPPFKPSGIVEAGAWVTYLFVLDQRATFAEYDRVEELRYRLSTMSIPRQPVEDGFWLPNTTCGISESTRTQTEQYYSYGSVNIPLRGVTEQKTALVMFDPSHRVRLEELEAVAPNVSKPRSMAEALHQSMAAQVARR